MSRILEKYKVSKPTVYVIKANMQKDGRFDEKKGPSVEDKIRTMIKQKLSSEEMIVSLKSQGFKEIEIEKTIAYIQHETRN